MTYFRRFFLDQSVFEFDPIEMMFTCLFLATKIEEIQFSTDIHQNIQMFCRGIGEEKYCTVDKLNAMEVFLVKAMRFQLVVYSPFQLIEYPLVQTVNEQVPELRVELLKRTITHTMVKLYQVEHLSFMYTPAQMALACLDVALTQLSQKGELSPSATASTDLTGYFPDIELSVWDKVGEIKKFMDQYTPMKIEDV